MTLVGRVADFCCELIPIVVVALVIVAAALAVTTYAPVSGITPATPVEEKPVVGTGLVIGLADVLVHEHEQREAAEKAFLQLRAEATGIVQTLINEINRLKSRPTLAPGMETADEPTPADPNG